MPGMNSGLARAYAQKTLAASSDTGPILLEAKNWTKWTFSAFSTGTVTGGSLLIFGTIDTNTSGVLGNPNLSLGQVQVPFTSAGYWFPLVAPSGQGESGASLANPITVFNGTQGLVFASPLVAVRATTNAFTGGGSIILQIEAVP